MDNGEINKESLLKIIKASDWKEGIPYDELPNLVKFYKKFTASHNKATVKFKLIPTGLEITYASDNIDEIIGYTPEDLVGSNLSQYSLSNPSEKKMQYIIGLLDAGEVVVKSSIIQHKQGGEVYTKSMIYKDKDRYIEFIWKASDELFI